MGNAAVLVAHHRGKALELRSSLLRTQPVRAANRSGADAARTRMTEVVTFLLFLAAWFVLHRFVLPRFGVST
jgi:hypothetical protein